MKTLTDTDPALALRDIVRWLRDEPWDEYSALLLRQVGLAIGEREIARGHCTRYTVTVIESLEEKRRARITLFMWLPNSPTWIKVYEDVGV